MDVERRLLPDEDRGYFLAYHDCQLRHYRPFGEIETELVERLSVLCWRQRRLSALETRIFVQHDPQDAEQMQAMLRQLNHLGRYENTLLRLVRDAEQRLEQLQRERFERDELRRRREMARAMAEAEDDDEYLDDEDPDEDEAGDNEPPAPPRPLAAAQNEPKPAPAPASPALPKSVMPLVGRVASPGELAVAKLLSKKR